MRCFRTVLAFCTIATLAGAGFLVVSLRAPETTIESISPVARQAVLTAARRLPAGTLLVADDASWAEVPINEIPPGAVVRRPGAEPQIPGDATRRAFRPGEVIVADQLIRPTEAGFLPAVLGAGMRAISLAVDAAEAEAGLIAPADHVDVILTQLSNAFGGVPGLRPVRETVLRDLRVIAVGRTTDLVPHLTPAAETRVPRTVTLEVTAHQAEVLTVARQRGKLQLTRRSPNEAEVINRAGSPGSVWGGELSRMSRYLSRKPAPGNPSPADPSVPVRPPPIAAKIIRDSQTEQGCFHETGWQSIGCAGAPTSSTGGKAGPLAPALAAHPA